MKDSYRIDDKLRKGNGLHICILTKKFTNIYVITYCSLHIVGRLHVQSKTEGTLPLATERRDNTSNSPVIRYFIDQIPLLVGLIYYFCR